MKLATVRITNFRSIEDSGEFDLHALLCLVGKNEAGKTAVLQALGGLNPHPSARLSYDIERDYPRRWLPDYDSRHSSEPATVATTKWALSDAEKAAIQDLLGEGVLADEHVTITRRYTDSAPNWNVDLNLKTALDNLIVMEGLDDEEKAPLETATNSATLIAALSAITEPSTRQKRLLDRFNSFTGKTITTAVEALLKPSLPQFTYSSHYDRMAGEIRIDQYTQRQNGQLQSPITAGESVFVDFLEYAGTSVAEIMAATTYEGLNARCEGASAKITDQLQEYWKQNPHIEIDVRVTKGEPGDPAPFNGGVVARARVKNTLHKMTVPFSERSAGFIWFFSFLVQFAQVRKTGGNVILLLDEPGLTLHGKAQADLLRYFEEKLLPHHQVIFTTHSPFMVPPNELPNVRIVEDRLIQISPTRWSSEGTKVRDDTMVTDRDTLFPLQGALGYEITQTLFVGKHTLLVEGPGDVLALQAFSSAMKARGKAGVNRSWTVCPAGGIDKIQPFVALFAGQKLSIAALSDYAKVDRRKLDNILQNKVLESSRLLTFASVLNLVEADLEDVFHANLYAQILNGAFGLTGAHEATGQKLIDADQNTTRLVKKAEAYFRMLPPELSDFDHYTPILWLFQHPEILDGDSTEVHETLAKIEQVVAAINRLSLE